MINPFVPGCLLLATYILQVVATDGNLVWIYQSD